MDELKKIWTDQAEYNRLFRQPPTTFEERADQTQEFVLHLEDELHELLRTVPWKKHRRNPMLANMAHSEEELADVFKYFVSLCQVHGVTPDRLIQLYWMKSMVMRQRYSEEFIKSGDLQSPCVVLDLDNVLCDYITGFGQWLIRHLADLDIVARVEDHVASRSYLSANSLSIDEWTWKTLKHEFRTSDLKVTLPAMRGAREFVDWCRKRWVVILLTSRPIDQYPNLYMDTLEWLHRNEIQVDFIWWAKNKANEIQKRNLNVVFAVDDELNFVREYAQAGISTYWVDVHRTYHTFKHGEHVTHVTNFEDIVHHYEAIKKE